MQMESSEEFNVVATIPAEKLIFNTASTTYTIVELPEGGGGRSTNKSLRSIFVINYCFKHTKQNVALCESYRLFCINNMPSKMLAHSNGML